MRPTTSDTSDTRHEGRSRRAPLLAFTTLVLVIGACATRSDNAGAPLSPAGPCAPSMQQSFPTATTPLLRAAEGLPAGRAPSFSVSLVPTVPVPIRIGAQLGFQLSSASAGYASLYVIDPVYDVQVLAENMPMPAGNLEYPSSQGFTLRAAEPVGFNRAILLVTRQPFEGFSGNDTLTTPVSTALDGEAFVSQLNAATRALPSPSWDSVSV